jgi:hypothetical protein
MHILACPTKHGQRKLSKTSVFVWTRHLGRMALFVTLTHVEELLTVINSNCVVLARSSSLVCFGGVYNCVCLCWSSFQVTIVCAIIANSIAVAHSSNHDRKGQQFRQKLSIQLSISLVQSTNCVCFCGYALVSHCVQELYKLYCSSCVLETR